MKMKLIASALLLASQMSTAFAEPTENSPQPTAGVAAFLKALNSGSGKPIEQLSVKDARAVLTGRRRAQNCRRHRFHRRSLPYRASL